MKRFWTSILINALLIIGLSCLVSCIKDLEDEGVFESTRCYGVVVDQRSQQPVADMRVLLTNGDLTSGVVRTAVDGSFEIEVKVDEIGQGYYLKVEADSLYEGREVSLKDMSMGIESYNVGTIYVDGPEVPIVITNDVSSVAASTVHCSGEVADGGKSAVVERGFVYSTMQYPTVSNSKVAVGSGIGSFATDLGNLQVGTTYYVRAYARNGVGVGYGDQVSFTTLDGLASVSTSSMSNITPTTAVSGGSVSDDGGFPVTAKGVCWSTTMQPTISNNHTSDGNGIGSFVSNVTGLEPGTTYYLRAYARNSSGVAYGEQQTFTTPSGLPEVTTNAVSSITSNTAICGGMVVSDGGFGITARGVVFSTSPDPTVAGPHTSDGVGVGAFVSQLTGLTTHTTYYVRAYATNGVGTVYGEQRVFVME